MGSTIMMIVEEDAGSSVGKAEGEVLSNDESG